MRKRTASLHKTKKGTPPSSIQLQCRTMQRTHTHAHSNPLGKSSHQAECSKSEWGVDELTNRFSQADRLGMQEVLQHEVIE